MDRDWRHAGLGAVGGLMRALLLSLLIASFPAWASDYIPPCGTTPTLYPVPVPARIEGLPSQAVGGSCGPYIVGWSANGVVGGYWCQADKTKRALPIMGAARPADFVKYPAMLADLALIPMAPDPGEAGRAFRAKYVDESIYNMVDVICPPHTDWIARFNAAEPPILAPPPPSTSLYVVAKRTGATTQATYAYAAGKRLPGAVGTIPILTGGLPTPCLDAPIIVEWPLTYVGVTPTTVAICTKR